MTTQKRIRTRGRLWELLSLGSLFMLIRSGGDSVWPIVFLAVLLFWSIDLSLRHSHRIRHPFKQHPTP